MSHHVLMERDEANPGSWTEFLREFVAEDERQANAPTEPDEPGDEPAGKPSGPGIGARVGDAAGTLIPRRAVSRLAGLPTPGGLGLVILALFFFVFAIVPVNVNGDTRLVLMWKALTGGITIPPGPRRQKLAQAKSDAQAKQVSGPVGFAESALLLIDPAAQPLVNFWNDVVIG